MVHMVNPGDIEDHSLATPKSHEPDRQYDTPQGTSEVDDSMSSSARLNWPS
jgi:hypothetical protein